MSTVRVTKPAMAQMTPLGPAMPMRFVIMTIRPEQAREMLESWNTRNRAKIPATVRTVAKALREGEWQLNGEAIIVCEDGILADGQNRLYGCVEANLPLTSLVAFGLPPSVFKTIDRGRSRDMSCDLSIVGEKNCAKLAAALKFIYKYECGLRDQQLLSSAEMISFDDVESLLRERPEIADSVRFSVTARVRLRVPHRILAAAHHLCGRVCEPDRDEFFARLVDGANLEPGNAILATRTKIFNLTANEAGKRRKSTGAQGGLLLAGAIWRGWNSWRRGESREKIVIPSKEHKGSLHPFDLPELI